MSSKIMIWGNSLDGSISGIIGVKDYTTGRKRLFLGSRREWTTETDDAKYIAKLGNEITLEQLEEMKKFLLGQENGSSESSPTRGGE